MFEFTEDYQIGIPEIDKEHEYLFQILSEAEAELNEGQVPLDILAGEFLDKLRDYASEHFVHEEAYMAETDDPELPRQQNEHLAFELKMSNFIIDSDITVEEVDELIHYVVRWLFAHILASDMMIGKLHVDKPIEEDHFAFTPKYHTHIDFIDEEHQVLFDILREVHDLAYDDDMADKYDDIVSALNRLQEYTECHFQHEEEYMESIHYPKLELQRTAHAAFIEKLSEMNKEINEIDNESDEEIYEDQHHLLTGMVDYLLSWLSNHILQADCLISKWEKETGF